MSYASSTASNGSSTLSTFLRRRLMGEVPIFGGDVRVGVSELGDAVMNTAHSRLTQALQNITGSLARLENRAQSVMMPPAMGVHYEDVERPQQLIAASRTHLAVATVDMEKIETLQDENLIIYDDLDTYRTFLRLLDKPAKRALPIKPVARVVEIKSDVSNHKIDELTAPKEPQLTALCQMLEIYSPEGVSCVKRAIIHTSVLGVSINATLASLGSSALSLHIRQTAMQEGKTVAEASALMQTIATKDQMCSRGIKHEIHLAVVVGHDKVRTDARNVLGTIMFALAGACYYVRGMEGIRKYAETFEVFSGK